MLDEKDLKAVFLSQERVYHCAEKVYRIIIKPMILANTTT